MSCNNKPSVQRHKHVCPLVLIPAHDKQAVCSYTAVTAGLSVSDKQGNVGESQHVTAPPLFYPPFALDIELPLPPCLHHYLPAHSPHFLLFPTFYFTKTAFYKSFNNISSLFICFKHTFFSWQRPLVAVQMLWCFHITLGEGVWVEGWIDKAYDFDTRDLC